MNLYEQALGAINRLFANRSISSNETLLLLRSLRDELDIMIDSLQHQEGK